MNKRFSLNSYPISNGAFVFCFSSKDNYVISAANNTIIHESVFSVLMNEMTKIISNRCLVFKKILFFDVRTFKGTGPCVFWGNTG